MSTRYFPRPLHITLKRFACPELKSDNNYQKSMRKAMRTKKSGTIMKRNKGFGIMSISLVKAEPVIAPRIAIIYSSSKPNLYIIQAAIKLVALTKAIIKRHM